MRKFRMNIVNKIFVYLDIFYSTFIYTIFDGIRSVILVRHLISLSTFIGEWIFPPKIKNK